MYTIEADSHIGNNDDDLKVTAFPSEPKGQEQPEAILERTEIEEEDGRTIDDCSEEGEGGTSAIPRPDAEPFFPSKAVDNNTLAVQDLIVSVINI